MAHRSAVPFLPPTVAPAKRQGWDTAAWIACLWFGCGRVPIAPGTAGTLGALPLYLLLRPLGAAWVAMAALVVTVIGVVASSRVARIVGQKDPQFICIDEVAGVLLTWVAAPANWKGTVLGFVLFRLFDMTKPFPARRCERLSGGLGIVLDDIAAGVWGAAVLVALRSFGWI